MPEVSETMTAIMYLLHKHRHMAAKQNTAMPKSKPDQIFRTALTNKEKAEIMELYEHGMTDQQIAEVIGRSSTSIATVIKQRLETPSP